MSLTEEQRKRIEESRQKALALRASRQLNSVDKGSVGKDSVGTPVATQIHHGLTTFSSCKSTNPSENVCKEVESKKPLYTELIDSRNSKQSACAKAPYGCFRGNGRTSVSAEGIKPAGSAIKSDLNAGSDAVVVKCLLVSRERFAVDMRYYPAVIEILKRITSRQYDAQTKMWSFSLKDYHALERELRNLKGAVTFEPLPSFVLRAFSNQLKGNCVDIKDVESSDLSNVDNKLVSALHLFQRQGVDFAIKQNGRLLIADDMGLGKTLQALCIAAYYRSEWPLLIMVPSSVRFAWRQQILEWLPSIDPQEINVMLTSKDSCSNGFVTIMSYDLMTRCYKQLENGNFNVVIVDESHFLKNSKSVRTKRALPLLKKAMRVILLSGTPAMSRPSELYTQLLAVDPMTFRSFHEYGLRYCNAKQMPWGWDYSGSSNLTELQYLMEERFMIRRLKQDVLSQLPSKQRTMVVLDPSSVSLDRVMTNSHSLVQAAKGQKRKLALLEYFHATGKAKINAVTEYVMDLLEADKKFLLFAHHQEILDAVEEAVKSAKFKSVRIDGKTTPEQRGFFCNRFQGDTDVRIAILSITAANAGLNLTAASLVVFAELFWNPGILVQAEDRVHRLGQLDSVNICYLVARNTADDYIWPLIQSKLNILGKAGLSKDDFCDTGTDVIKDSKQRDLLAYFKESFLEEDSELDDRQPGNSNSTKDCVTQCGKSARQPETTAPSTTGDKRRPTDAKPEDDYCAADWSDDVTVDWFNDGEMALGLSEENNNNSDGGVQQSSRGFENDGHDPPLMKKSKLR